MRKTYMKPVIGVVPQRYDECLMQTLSLGTGTGGATAPPDAKPGDSWGEPLNDESWGDTWDGSNTNC